MELDWQYASKLAETAGTKTKAWSVPLFATAKFYIPGMNSFSVFGKLDYAYNRLKANDSINLWRPVAATSLGYNYGNLGVFAQYQYNWLPNGGQNMGQSTYSIGLSYTFGTSSHWPNNEDAIGADSPYQNEQQASKAQATMLAHESYTVKKGDTLYKIAQAQGKSAEKVAFAKCVQQQNNLPNQHDIYFGQKLDLTGC